MKVVGIDPSLTSLGVATIHADGAVHVDHHGRAGHNTDTLRDTDQRIADLCGFTWQWTREADLVVIEGMSYGQARASAGHRRDLAGLWWRIVHQLLMNDLRVAEVPPATRAKWATGKGNADKATVGAHIARLHPTADITCSDEADALCLATMGAQALGWTPTLARQAGPLNAVTWPDDLPQLRSAA